MKFGFIGRAHFPQCLSPSFLYSHDSSLPSKHPKTHQQPEISFTGSTCPFHPRHFRVQPLHHFYGRLDTTQGAPTRAPCWSPPTLLSTSCNQLRGPFCRSTRSADIEVQSHISGGLYYFFLKPSIGKHFHLVHLNITQPNQ